MNERIKIKSRILVAITANTGRDMYPAGFANSLIKMCRAVSLDYYIDIHTFGGLRIDVVRTEAVLYAQKNGFDAILFIDDDMIFPENTMIKLICHWESGMKVVTGLYGSKSPPFHVFIRPDLKKDWLHSCGDGLYQTQAIATGCALIDLKVFDVITKPWFLLHFDKNFGRLITTEDCFFSIRCNDADIPMFVDASIVCQHLRMIPIPAFFDHPNIHYDGEYRPKKIPENPDYRKEGPLVMHSMEGSYASDGVMDCRHDHQMPIQMNKGEKQLYRCMDCDLISEGADFANCNILDLRVMSPKELNKELTDMENMKFDE